jgi:hypothetical protein
VVNAQTDPVPGRKAFFFFFNTPDGCYQVRLDSDIGSVFISDNPDAAQFKQGFLPGRDLREIMGLITGKILAGFLLRGDLLSQAPNFHPPQQTS